MKKKNVIVAASLVSAMTLTAMPALSAVDFTTADPIATYGTTNTGTVLMNQETTLKYLDTGIDPADGTQAKDKWGQYTGWTRSYKNGDNASLNGQYNDDAWKEGNGTFDSTSTTLSADSKAYFFRGYFKLDDASKVDGIHLNFDYKDAVIVYINGQQLTALNVPDEGYRTTGDASGSHKDNLGYGSGEKLTTAKNADLYFRDIKDMLVAGDNVISFEVHKSDAASSGYLQLNEMAINPDESLLPARAERKAISLSIGNDATQMNVTWYSLASDGGQLQYAKKADMTGDNFPVAKATTVTATSSKAQAEAYYSNKASMDNLAENTEYVYRVGNNGNFSEVFSTKTKTKGDFSFLFAGDPQLGSSGDLASDKDGWKNTLDLINTDKTFSNVSFIQNAGDHVEAGKNETQYDAYLSNYEGSVVYSTPIANAVGNHDYSGTAYNDHFNLPNVSNLGSSGEGNAEGDYYYVYNNTLMMVLNSNNRSTAEHKEFIENTYLKTKDNQDIKWKIVVFHHSIYSTASHASDGDILDRRSTLAPAFKEAGIDLVLMGHDHVYTRSMLMDGAEPLKEASFDANGNPISEVTDPEGITYITANSASGSKYYEFSDKLTGEYVAVKNQEHTPNITKLDVKDNQLKIITYRTTDMSVVDDYTINKTVTENVDKTELNAKVDELAAIDGSKYTEASYQALQTALANARAIIADKNATAEQVAQALSDLETAKAGLIEKTTTTPNKKDPTVTTKPTTTTTTTKKTVKTGDDKNIKPLILTVVASGVLAGAVYTTYIKKRN